jgi:hypothetical protein
MALVVASPGRLMKSTRRPTIEKAVEKLSVGSPLQPRSSLTVITHTGVIVPSWSPALGYFWLGGGVDLFFAISDF